MLHIQLRTRCRFRRSTVYFLIEKHQLSKYSALSITHALFITKVRFCVDIMILQQVVLAIEYLKDMKYWLERKKANLGSWSRSHMSNVFRPASSTLAPTDQMRQNKNHVSIMGMKNSPSPGCTPFSRTAKRSNSLDNVMTLFKTSMGIVSKHL